jgi:hypothetical protein
MNWGQIVASSTSVDGFKQIVRDGVDEICREFGWHKDKDQERGYAFQRWVGRLFVARDGLDVDVEAGCFHANDLKIDLALEDVDRKVLYLVQTKFMSLAALPTIDEDPVTTFFERHSTFLDKPEWVQEHAGSELLDFVGNYRDRLEEGWLIRFYFVATGRASERLQKLVEAHDATLRAAFSNVACELIDFYKLKEIYVQSQSLEQSIPDLVELQLPKESFIEKDSPHQTLVAIVKGTALVALYRRHKESIFAYNIRSYLGKNSLNKEIIATAQTEAKNFFYFNNGVSAICSGYSIEPKTRILRAKSFQIINGAQTVGALSSAGSGLSSDVEVLVRLTVSGSVKTEKGFNAEIIRYNNTQNVVKLSDFRANDAIQLWLEKTFQDLRPRGAQEDKIVYERKRSFHKKKGVHVLRLEDLSKIRYGFFHEPTRCVGDPKSLWTSASDGGVYEQAFGVDGELVSHWPEAELKKTLFAVLVYQEIEDRINDRIKRDRKFLWMRRLRFFALALAARYLSLRHLDPEKLLAGRKEFESFFSEFWKAASLKLSDIYSDVQTEKTTMFAYVRSDQKWRSLREKFETYLEMTSD